MRTCAEGAATRKSSIVTLIRILAVRGYSEEEAMVTVGLSVAV